MEYRGSLKSWQNHPWLFARRACEGGDVCALNTIIVGAPGDVVPSTGAEIGAAGVFTRTNGV